MWQVVRRTVRRRWRHEELWNGNREGPLWRNLVDREYPIPWAWHTRRWPAAGSTRRGGVVRISPSCAAQSRRDRRVVGGPQLRRYAGATSLIASPIRWMRSALVEPGMPGGEPAMITTRSPSLTRPISRSCLVDLAHHLVGVLDVGGQERLDTPGQRQLRAHLGLGGERQHRDRGRGSATSRLAESPDWVKATRYVAPTRSATSAAALAITPPRVCGCQSIAAMLAQLVVLGGGDDPGHRLDRLDGVLPHARLARQHHRVGAVEDRVGDVGGLGAGRRAGW